MDRDNSSIRRNGPAFACAVEVIWVLQLLLFLGPRAIRPGTWGASLNGDACLNHRLPKVGVISRQFISVWRHQMRGDELYLLTTTIFLAGKSISWLNEAFLYLSH
jgi:hypothetical protein